MLLRHRFVCFRHSILTSHGWYILSQVQQFQTSSGFQVDARYRPVNSVCLHLETLHLYLFFINYFHESNESWIIYLKFNNYWILMNKLHINSLYEETAIFIHDISVRARVPGATSRHVATCRSRYQQRLNKHSSRYSTSTNTRDLPSNSYSSLQTSRHNLNHLRYSGGLRGGAGWLLIYQLHCFSTSFRNFGIVFLKL